MFLIKTTKALESLLEQNRKQNRKIGFVATMGALHNGHIELIKRSKRENDITLCSIFVNPRQFNDPNDLLKYPQPIDKDIILLESSGCDILFHPSAEVMYPKEFKEADIQLGNLAGILEGAMRPGHFKGVALVVKQLLDCVKPDRAYFGQKDFQQTLVIKALVKQFNIPVEIIVHDIVRESNGLAMSSRNIRLSDDDKEQAGFIYQVLMQLKERLKKVPVKEALESAANEILEHPGAVIEYLTVADAESLEPVNVLEPGQKAVALVVVNYHGVRLLDNILVSG